MRTRRRSVRVAILGSRGFPSTYSGYETLVRHLAPALHQRGWDVTVYCRPADVERANGAGHRDEIDGVRRVWTAGINGKSLSTLSHGLTSCRTARRGGYDAALVLNVANGFFLPMLRRAGVPVAVNVDGIEWERDKWSALGKRVFRAGATTVARHADVVVADSQAIGTYWQHEFGRTSTFIPYGAVVHHDVPADRLAEVGVTPGRYVLVIARIVPENNLTLFLDALPALDASTEVVVVGSASGRSALEDRLRSLSGSRANVRWLGHVSDQELLRQLRAHCGVYWHGHSVGGTNPSLLEAMGCGAPVIAVDTVYNREVLGDDDQLCAAEPAIVGAALRRLLEDAPRRARFARSEVAIVEHRYRWDDVCDRYAEVVEELSHRRPLDPARRVGPAWRQRVRPA